jgi:S-adenosylmethionine-dependent methyltransferase
MDYAKFTARELFNSAFDSRAEDALINLARWGRGVSFHEFVIALGSMEKVKVVSAMQSFLGERKRLYEYFLKHKGPGGIHEGFYKEYLYIALKK